MMWWEVEEGVRSLTPQSLFFFFFFFYLFDFILQLRSLSALRSSVLSQDKKYKFTNLNL